jgi:two-component system cell cycle sensor histidine kinase/response regulator CckA
VINQLEQLDMKPATKGSALSNSPVGKIIVVDDEPELRSILVEALSDQGFEVKGCSDGDEALAALRTKEYDLLLTDLMMPEMDGITLLEAALEVDPHLIGIMMTGQGTIQTAVDAMKLGAFDYVLKPFRIQTVMPVLTRAINTRRLRMENLQLRETVAIYSLCQTIAFTLDAQTVLSKLADAAVQQSDADEVSILLPTSEGTELYVAAVRGEKRERLLGERVPLHDSISSWVAREREPLIINGEVRDERFMALWPRPEIQSAVSVPMQVANKLVGIINLNVINRLRPFTLGQMKALTILASTAAAALESASLYKQVQKAEKNYRSIFENAVEGIFQSTLDGRFIAANPSMARILGYDSPEELISTITDIAHQLYVHPEFRQKAAEIEERCGVVHGFEFEAYRKGGEKIWLSLNRRCLRNENGTEIFCEGSVEDITERKRSEAERLVLFEIIQGVNTTRNLEELFKLIHKSIDKILYARNCFVGLFEETTSLMTFEYWADHFEPVPDPHPPGKAFSSHVLRTNQALLLTNELRNQMFASGQAEQMGRSSASWLGVPLRISSRAIGVLVVQHYEEENAYSQRDLEFLCTVADQIALAIERKQAEKALRESEERYRDLVENAHDLIYEHDLKGNYTSANAAGEHMTGYSLAETLQLNLLQTVAPESLKKAQDMLRRKLAGESVTAYELEVIAKDGRRIPIEVNTRLVLRDGVAVGVQGIARDITKRKQSEKALRHSEARTRAILESAMDCIITMDHTGQVVDWNPAAEKAFGYSFEEAVGREMAELIIPLRYREHHRQGLARYLATGSARVMGNRIELSATRADGAEFPVELTITRIELEGNPMFTGYVRDITNRKEAESRLAAQYAVTRALAESNTISEGALETLKVLCESLGWEFGALWTIEPAQGVLRCAQLWNGPDGKSDEFEKMSRTIGFAPGIGIPGRVWKHGQPLWISEVTADENIPRSTAAAEAGFHSACGFPIPLRAEVMGVVEFFSRSTRKPDPALLAMMATIGSQIGQFIERKRVETALVDSEEQLRQSQKLEAIGQLAGGVAHDFNNLLTVIGGYSSILLNKLEQDSPLRVSVQEIKRASDRAAGLTRQLLAFSRKQILQPKILDLNLVVSDLEKMVRRLIGEDVDLLAITDPNLGQVKADPGQLEQVLLNLIVNARDAMPSGGKLTIETANAILSPDYALSHGAPGGPYVMLAVSDTGSGMDAELQNHVFEPFFTTKVPGKGTGLGLATVYGIVKQSDGHIWLYSEVGKGTCFKIYLPRVDDVVTDEVNTGGLRLAPKGTETLLLVEDEDQVRQIVKAILEQQGYDVFAAANGEEALKLAELHGPRLDLLVTDLVMPQMSGRELAEQLSLTLPDLKVLYMSGYTDDAIVRHGLLDASLSFIQKPFDSATAARKVREVLDSGVL